MNITASLAMFALVLLLAGFQNNCVHEPKLITATEGIERLKALPEVRAFAQQLQHAPKGTQLIIRPDVQQEDAKSPLLEFYVGEDHETHITLWQRFAIDRSTGQFFIYDVESGDYTSLESWRQQQGHQP